LVKEYLEWVAAPAAYRSHLKDKPGRLKMKKILCLLFLVALIAAPVALFASPNVNPAEIQSAMANPNPNFSNTMTMANIRSFENNSNLMNIETATTSAGLNWEAFTTARVQVPFTGVLQAIGANNDTSENALTNTPNMLTRNESLPNIEVWTALNAIDTGTSIDAASNALTSTNPWTESIVKKIRLNGAVLNSVLSDFKSLFPMLNAEWSLGHILS
jgi:hypothetical protein